MTVHSDFVRLVPKAQIIEPPNVLLVQNVAYARDISEIITQIFKRFKG